jgi:hypothetical protein
MRRFSFLTTVLLLLSVNVWAQVGLDSAKYKALRDYAASFNIDRLINQNPNFRVSFEELRALFGAYPNHVEEDGHIIFIDTDNERAARATKTNLVIKGSPLGYRLSGRGMRMTVIDEAGVRLTHDEFGGRVTQKDGDQELNNHATHVAGTMIASGRNTLARGMASEALLDAYSFNNWQSKIVQNAQNGVFLSNQSFGIIAGWRQVSGVWRWYGSPNVSETEDFKFGFYSSNSRFIDELHYVYPQYLAVFSAGNNRNTNGPPANNPEHEIQQGSTWVKSTVVRDPNPQYGSLTYYPVAKNALAIGAISIGTTGEVSMASFSSWGPTDDGRIKPDLVGQGVGVLSSVASGDDRYGSSNGTSMSSPNVTGSLLLLKEHFLDVTDSELRLGSTLKAIAIHGAVKPPVTTFGPDYRYGWGLLDMQRSVKIIDNYDQTGFLLLEDTLRNGQTKEYAVQVQEEGPFIATIVWADPPGRVPATSLNPRDTILVNDLDIKVIRQSDGQEFFPWILNPQNPGDAATRGINFLDNVEKIEIPLAHPGTYTIRVTHKKQLTNNLQVFSLVASSGDLSDSRRELYFVAKNGHNWNDPANWSFSDGGTSANLLPTKEDVVVFTNNSFDLTKPMVIQINQSAECQLFDYRADEKVEFRLTSNLTVYGSIFIRQQQKFTGAGKLILSAELLAKNGINAPDSDFSAITISMEGKERNRWELDAKLKAGKIELNGGQFDLLGNDLVASKLVINESNLEKAALFLENGKITGLDTLIFQGLTSFASGNSGILEFNNPSRKYYIEGDNISLGRIRLDSGETHVFGLNQATEIFVNTGKLFLNNSLALNNLVLNGATDLNLASGTTINVKVPDFNNGEGKIINLSTIGQGSANFLIPEPIRLCFDYLRIGNVNLVGEGTVAAGRNSVLVGNGTGWNLIDCDDILFADFTSSGNCAFGFVNFKSQSTGQIIGRRWDFGNPSAGQDNFSTLENPRFIYTSAGTYNVTLSIYSATDTAVVTRPVKIENSNIVDLVVLTGPDNELIPNQNGNAYQWYKDGQLIDGATNREYKPSENGNYQVELFRDGCSRLSPVFVISNIVTSIGELGDGMGIIVYPNPANSRIFINFGDAQFTQVSLRILALSGQELQQTKVNSIDGVVSMDVSTLGTGLYILQVESAEGVSRFKILKN